MSVNSKMTAIADAIRAKTGGTGLLTLDDMAQDIAAIDTSENLDEVLDEQDALIADIKSTLAEKGVKPEQTKTATPSLSQQTIVPDSGKTLSEVTVEPITAELLASLDPDFKPENIAANANLFGLIGTLAASAGMQVATGTKTSTTVWDPDEHTITSSFSVTGLNFEPKIILILSAVNISYIDFVSMQEAEDEDCESWDEIIYTYWFATKEPSNMHMTCGPNVMGYLFESEWASSNAVVPGNLSLTSNGFSIITDDDPSGSAAYFRDKYTWYAIG